jgi:hypothetical protein
MGNVMCVCCHRTLIPPREVCVQFVAGTLYGVRRVLCTWCCTAHDHTSRR